MIPPCSNEVHPGLWEIPLVPFKSGVKGSACGMADTCFRLNICKIFKEVTQQLKKRKKNSRNDSVLTAEQVFDYFLFNFERHKETRVPFGIYQHAWWFLGNNAILEGFLQFLDYLGTFDYVYIVTVSQASISDVY